LIPAAQRSFTSSLILGNKFQRFLTEAKKQVKEEQGQRMGDLFLLIVIFCVTQAQHGHAYMSMGRAPPRASRAWTKDRTHADIVPRKPGAEACGPKIQIIQNNNRLVYNRKSQDCDKHEDERDNFASKAANDVMSSLAKHLRDLPESVFSNTGETIDQTSSSDSASSRESTSVSNSNVMGSVAGLGAARGSSPNPKVSGSTTLSNSNLLSMNPSAVGASTIPPASLDSALRSVLAGSDGESASSRMTRRSSTLSSRSQRCRQKSRGCLSGS